jgi:hypothetical protein
MVSKPTNDRKPRRPLSRDEMIARVKALARECGVRTVSRRHVQTAAGISRRQMVRNFGSHAALMEACGLKPIVRRAGPPDDVLLRAMHAAFTKAGGIISGQRFNRTCPHGRGAYKSRWRNWAGALRAYRTWLRRHHADVPYMTELDQRCKESSERTNGPAAWKGCGGTRLGAPLGGGALQHAPTNELGVVFLFGALAPSLGYMVERLGTRFPDCIAKRRLREPGNIWESVRVEFEYRSGNFLKHKHDPKQCDVIVCWEHDWRDCPIEVLELSREVAAPK